MSRFHQPRRGWLPQLLDGLKLALLGIFLISYMALSIPGYEFQIPEGDNEPVRTEAITDIQGDSIN